MAGTGLIGAFLQSGDGGLGIGVSADQTTKDALQRALVRLADEPLDSLREAAPLRALILDGLIHPDHRKNLLRWLDNPKVYRDESTDHEWAAFVDLCEAYYSLNPDRDGQVTAAEKLGQQDGQLGNGLAPLRRSARKIQRNTRPTPRGKTGENVTATPPRRVMASR